MSAANSPAAKRTTDRDIPIGVRLIRLWFAATARLAPGVAEWQAARLFLTPRRHQRGGRESELSLAACDTALRRYAIALRAGDLRLRAWSWGEGPAVLLAHGWEGSAADLVPLAGALVDAGYRAVLVDFPAHGRSAGRRTSLVEWLRALRAVAGAVGPIHAVVGHSFGGLAVTVGLAEGDVSARGAVLLAPALGPAEFVERFAGMIGLPAERAAGMERRLADRVGRNIASLDARRAARSLAIPALVLHDPRDREVPWEHARAIADAWAGSRLVSREGRGHRRILADAETIASVVDFVARLDDGATTLRLLDALPRHAPAALPG